ncbi:MAG: DUF4863 family protein [Pseudomonadota bacterium]|nr:DUF4863 family protein [Pseudomonadota bacterium]
MTKEALLAQAADLVAVLRTLDATEPAAAEQALRGLRVSGFEAALRTAHAEGWATPKEAGGVRFGRITRADATLSNFSLDIVEMSGSAGGAHTHPAGEFDLSFALDGEPRFDGRAPGWVVYPPGSRHVPTVTGGRMLIAYFLPGGEIAFEPQKM